MKRSIKLALCVVLAALAVPAAALATHDHGPAKWGDRHHHHRHGTQTGATTPSTAGTVSSYSNGTLTISLNGGGSITGQVTDRTHLKCLGDRGRHEGRRFDHDHHWGDTGASGPAGDTGATGNTGTTGPATPPPPCESSLLAGGVSVVEANVELSAQGVFFVEIILPAVQ